MLSTASDYLTLLLPFKFIIIIFFFLLKLFFGSIEYYFIISIMYPNFTHVPCLAFLIDLKIIENINQNANNFQFKSN